MKAYRLKDLGRWYSGGTPPRDQESLWCGDVPWLSAKDVAGTELREPVSFITTDAAVRHSRVVPSGSLLLVVRGMALVHGLPVVQVDQDVAFNQDLRALVCAKEIEPRFAYYSIIGHRWKLDEHIDRAAHGTARVRDSIYGARIPVPSRARQVAIVDFLDRECARIDELQALLVQQLALVGEEREVAVREAISGLRFGPLKYGFSVVDCKHRTPSYTDTGFPVISTREVHRGYLDLSRVDRFVSRLDYEDMIEGGRDPQPGDIVYSRNASVGVAAYIRDPMPVCMGQDVVLITRRPRDCELLSYVLNYAVADQVEQRSFGSTFSRINVPVIRSLVVPYDSQENEEAALARIRSRFDELGRLEIEMRQLASKLAEYRDALITEAVTGQLEVAAIEESGMEERLHAALEGEAVTP